MKIINKKAIILLISLSILGVYFLTPQLYEVPNWLKRIVFSCYREGEKVPTMPDEPKCCIGLTEEFPELTTENDDSTSTPKIGDGRICTKAR